MAVTCGSASESSQAWTEEGKPSKTLHSIQEVSHGEDEIDDDLMLTAQTSNTGINRRLALKPIELFLPDLPLARPWRHYQGS